MHSAAFCNNDKADMVSGLRSLSLFDVSQDEQNTNTNTNMDRGDWSSKVNAFSCVVIAFLIGCAGWICRFH